MEECKPAMERQDIQSIGNAKSHFEKAQK